MEIVEFRLVTAKQIIGACLLLCAFHVDFNFGHTTVHNERQCSHKHPKIHDVSFVFNNIDALLCLL